MAVQVASDAANTAARQPGESPAASINDRVEITLANGRKLAVGATLDPMAGKLAGVHLYGLARPSQQPAAPRLSALPKENLVDFAALIENKTGIRVVISP